MEVASSNHEHAGPYNRGWLWLKALPKKLVAKVVEAARKAKKLGQDDPRKIIHSLKVGLALALVSLFYYCRPLYDAFGVNATWAVLTVVVVFEFYVGATLGRGLNRIFATMAAGALGVKAHDLASLSGEKGEPVLLGFFVFLIGAAFTFLRFFPEIKARYDYGLMIFILTFSLVTVSSYREDEVLVFAHQRLSTVAIGSCISVIVCIFICPVWVGEDLQNLVAVNIEKLGSFLEGFGVEYFKTAEDGQSNDDKSFREGYKSVLSSKTSEESMANLARWEPCHGRFRFRHPWKQYLIIATLTRQCAYNIEALNSFLNSKMQMPIKMRSKIQDPCTKIISEAGQTLNELANAIKTMTRPSSVDSHIENSKTAADNLKALLHTGLFEETDLLEIIPSAAVASLLIDIVTCTEKISEAVQELASLAHFKSVEQTVTEPEQPQIVHQVTEQPFSSNAEPHHVITVDESSSGSPENENGPVLKTG
ncbi:hypothetical protein L1049_013697 [Liquidambar formosana]|uniref:Aluminum-activated malate transporter n=1 Tax=Liquidambar formosana TaxID=63359 RepID=A0AAP0WUI5_LIQFO